MESVRFIVILIAVASVRCVDAPVVALALGPHLIPAAAVTGVGPCLPPPACPPPPPCPACSPAPEPAPSPEPEDGCKFNWEMLRWAGFIFATLGIVGRAIPWIAFRCMKAEDWKKVHVDAFTERTLLLEILCSIFTILVPIMFLPEIDWVPVLTEFTGMWSSMELIYHIQEKKAEGAGKSHKGWGRFLFWGFWIFVCFLSGFFYRILNFAPIKKSTLAFHIATVFTASALICRLLSVFVPFGCRIMLNHWEEDPTASYRGKVADALTRILSSLYDSWKYGCRELYWDQGQGKQHALVLALGYTVLGMMLLIARLISPTLSKKFCNFVRGLCNHDPLGATLPVTNATNAPQDVNHDLEVQIQDLSRQIKQQETMNTQLMKDKVEMNDELLLQGQKLKEQDIQILNGINRHENATEELEKLRKLQQSKLEEVTMLQVHVNEMMNTIQEDKLEKDVNEHVQKIILQLFVKQVLEEVQEHIRLEESKLRKLQGSRLEEVMMLQVRVNEMMNSIQEDKLKMNFSEQVQKVALQIFVKQVLEEVQEHIKLEESKLEQVQKLNEQIHRDVLVLFLKQVQGELQARLTM